MSKAIFTTRSDTTYKDVREERYHFPRTYLRQAEQAVGDWIIYYEPRRGEGRQAYFATARVDRIEADTDLPDHFYAYLSDYLEFVSPVPYRETAGFYETALLGTDGQPNLGSFQRAVRLLPEYEYEAILRAGFGNVLSAISQNGTQTGTGLADVVSEFERPVVESIVRRPVRDEAFRRTVERAYDATCAMTGLRIINGGGRAEIEAAHIKPVAGGHKGPDSVRNGIALSRTFHWLFDRGLVSLSDKCEILVAEEVVPPQVTRMINSDRQLLAPIQSDLRPHPVFVRYHRERIFKG